MTACSGRATIPRTKPRPPSTSPKSASPDRSLETASFQLSDRAVAKGVRCPRLRARTPLERVLNEATYDRNGAVWMHPSFPLALRWLWCGFEVALGSHWCGFGGALGWLWGGLGVALGWLWGPNAVPINRL